jgi:uncharacterized protein
MTYCFIFGEDTVMTQPGNEKRMRTITLEEHFATPEFMHCPGREMSDRVRTNQSQSPLAFINAQLIEQLLDLDDLRIADMDAAGIDMQVFSLNSPGLEQLDAAAAVKLACQTNYSLGEAIKHHPDRFAGFAALATDEPETAAIELERTVRDYGFKGAVINGNNRGGFLDDSFFDPFSSGQKLSRFRSISTLRHLHSRSFRPTMLETLHRKFQPNGQPQAGLAY